MAPLSVQAPVPVLAIGPVLVAIAPVTDLQAFKNDRRDWTDFYLTDEMIGDGSQVRDGSPARNANKIKVPVLLFHGTLDANVPIAQSQRMAKSLEAVKANYRLVTFDNLDHALDDSAARTEMLTTSDDFLRRAFELPAH